MKSVAYEMRAQSEPLVRVEREIGPPKRGEALIAVVGCGVCHTDLGFLYDGVPTRRPLPLVLGHEIAGVIVAVGPDVFLAPGTPVVVPAVLPCGVCVLCRRGRGDVCRAQIFPGNDVDGGFATHVVVPARGLCPLPRGVVPEGRELAQLAVCADAKPTLAQLLGYMENFAQRSAWLARIDALRTAYPLPITPDDAESVKLMHALAAELEASDTVTTDVGQHQMWAAQYLPFHEPRRWLTSGGLGTMGFGLPAAIGAALANQKAGRVICITGDGSLLMNIQEFATLAELGLPVKIILLDNGHLGLVRQQQQMFFSGRFSACEFSSAVDFMRIAQAFGLAATSYDSTNPDCLSDFLSAEGPGLLHARIAATEKVLPMVAPGAGNLQMIVEDVEALVST